jgi:hypothetical protein
MWTKSQATMPSACAVTPCRSTQARVRIDAGHSEDLPDGYGAEWLFEVDEFALDATAAPAWILYSKVAGVTENTCAHRRRVISKDRAANHTRSACAYRTGRVSCLRSIAFSCRHE